MWVIIKSSVWSPLVGTRTSCVSLNCVRSRLIWDGWSRRLEVCQTQDSSTEKVIYILQGDIPCLQKGCDVIFLGNEKKFDKESKESISLRILNVILMNKNSLNFLQGTGNYVPTLRDFNKNAIIVLCPDEKRFGRGDRTRRTRVFLTPKKFWRSGAGYVELF